MRLPRAVIAVLALVAAGGAHAATPLPQRGNQSVYDTAGVLDAQTEARIETLDRQLFDKAGVAIVVLTVPKLEGETIGELALRVQETWGVGVKGKNESVVIALAVEDREIFFATGYGSEPYLPDGKVGEIRDRVTPALGRNDYASGLTQAVREIADVAAAAHGVKVIWDDSVGQGGIATTNEPARTGCDDNLLTIAIVLVVVLAFAFRRRGRRGGGGGFFMFPGGGWSGGRDDVDFGGRGDGGGFGGFGGGTGGGGGAGGRF
jgi:uncharacterized protein